VPSPPVNLLPRRSVEPLGLRSQQATLSVSPTRQPGSSGGRTSRSGMLFRVAGQLPLTTLLAWAWLTFTIEADNAVEAAGSEHLSRLFRISMAMWANGLRLIGEEGVTVGELQARAKARCNIGGLERWGWISMGEPGGKRRAGYGTHRGVKVDTVLRPTRAGSYARRLWPGAIATVEERWRARFGDELLLSLDEALRPLAGGMPWAPPEVHPSDGFISHVIEGPLVDEEAPLAAHMAQVLTALTLGQERGAEVSLPLGANFIRVIGTDVVRTRDLPLSSGVSKEAVAMSVKFLQRRHLAEAPAGGLVKLTATGLDALDGFWTRAAGPKNEPLRAVLTSVVRNRQALADGLAPPAGCWRGAKPYLAQTERLLADPTAALPWQPMVLHRGGWPDGS
jgi:hypothetical protein